MSQTVRQKDTVSLVRDGSFAAGLSFWNGQAEHIVVGGQAATGPNLVSAPHYAAAIPAGEAITQRVQRDDAYLFPSRRYVTAVNLAPFGISTYKVVITAATRVDGLPVVGDTFLYSDEDGIVPLIPGQQIELADTFRTENGGHYRVGRLFDDGSVEVSPIQHDITKLASDATHTLTYSSNGATGSVAITGATAFTRGLDNDDSLRGVQAGDTLIIDDPSFGVGYVTSVSISGDVTTFAVTSVEGAPFLADTGGDPVEPDTAASDTWFLSTTTVANFQRDLRVYQYSFTLGFSTFPDNYDGVPTLAAVDRDGHVVVDIPAFQLDGGAIFESLSLSATGTTAYQRRLYRFFSEERAPLNLDLQITIPGGTEGASVGDVVLYRGDYTNRHDFDDRDDPTTSVVADQRSAVDRMLHPVDEYECVIPKGTVIMYAGGPTCPPGFKSVDALAGATERGIELLPTPDSVSYDVDRNRTIIEWADRDFPLLDAAGRTIPVLGDASQIQVTLPAAPPFHGALESIVIGPTQQRLQPGMSLGVRASNVPGNYEYDFSAPIRQAFVDRQELAGSPPTAVPGGVHDITYPLFLSASQFDAGERNFDPIGPDKVGQPTSYSFNTSVFPNNQGSSLARPATFGGLTDGAPTMTFTGVGLTGLGEGELVYVRWISGSLSGNFIAKIDLNQSGNVTVSRADGHAMVADGTTGSISGTGYFADAKVFGVDALVTRTLIANDPVWSARRFDVRTIATVFGDVTAEIVANNTDGIVLEPSGFIRYGTQDFDRGDLGHSHLVTAGDADFDANVAPHVNAANEFLAPTRVARDHGHGHFSKHHHVIPRFFAVIPCIKM